MTERSACLALLLCAATPVFAEERTLPLEKVKPKKGEYVLSESFGGENVRLGANAYRLEIDGRELLFFDLDEDDRLDKRDGLALAGHPFVVPLPEELLLAGGQYVYEFEGTRKVVLRLSELEVDEECFPTAIALTEVRIRAGLRPLVVDAGLSQAARRHLDYLDENEVVGRQLTMEAHDENPRLPGYTEEGAHAGRNGILGNGDSLTADVMAWFSTAFHGVKLLDPAMSRAGLARRHGLSLLYPESGGAEVNRPFFHPPDGARHVPPTFSRGGEIPSPVPDRRLGAGTGFPVMVWLPPAYRTRPVLEFSLQDAAGVAVKGYVSSPLEPASEVFPRNMGCAFFIPYTRLENGETYTASFRQQGGVSKRWSFRTWEWEAGR